MELTEMQQQALKGIEDFLTDESAQIFILKGYAGTGKTTLLRQVLPLARQTGRMSLLMAPTGRAAKVLKEKIGLDENGQQRDVRTVHRTIYSFTDVKETRMRINETGEIVKDGQAKGQGEREVTDTIDFYFQIKPLDKEIPPSHFVGIVDEASMVGSRQMPHEQLHFGTDVLLDDLLAFMKLEHGGKLIFVGDPAQLPPIGENYSAALDEDYFREKGYKVASFELTEVLRQDANNVILENAMKVRDLLHSSTRNHLEFTRKAGEFEDISQAEIPDAFSSICPTPSINECVVVCYSNAMAKYYNDAIRQEYWGGDFPLRPGDICQVVRNHYSEEIDLYNGDFVRVISAEDRIESRKQTVNRRVGDKTVKVEIELTFRNVTFMDEHGNEFELKIFDNLLNNEMRDLTLEEFKALFIDLKKRTGSTLKSAKEQGQDLGKVWANILMTDPYYNALHVKYGYAITGHKSQGGEWGTVFADYTRRTGLGDDELRWNYTVTTRASRCLYGAQLPNITPVQRLKFNAITKISKPSKGAFAFAPIEAELLPETATNGQKQKFNAVKRGLQGSGFSITKVELLNYRDRYTLSYADGNIVVDCIYNGSGLYTGYAGADGDLLKVFQDDSSIEYAIDYVPASPLLQQLHNVVQSACDELNVRMTNVVSDQRQFFVNYYLKTSGKFSYLQFYFTKSGFLTHCLCFSDMGGEDELLQCLIKKINELCL